MPSLNEAQITEQTIQQNAAMHELTTQLLPLRTKILNSKKEEEAVSVIIKKEGSSKDEKSNEYICIIRNAQGDQIGLMKFSFASSIKWINDYLHILIMKKENSNYKYVGTALHEVAFKMSLYYGKQGRVLVGAGYASILFHFGCGYRAIEEKFPWRALEVNDFTEYPQLGQKAYLAWKRQSSEYKPFYSEAYIELEEASKNAPILKATLNKLQDLEELQDAPFNEVLQFYYELYNAHPEFQEVIATHLEKLSQRWLHLPDETIEQKKLEYKKVVTPQIKITPNQEMTRKQFNKILDRYHSTSWISYLCFFNPDRSRAIRELRQLSNNIVITKEQIQRALMKDSQRRLALFNEGARANHTSTDQVILALYDQFRL